MKIKSISISGIGGLRNINIDFNDQFNFICGPNGIGKTTILECVAHTFSSDGTKILKRNALSDKGTIESVISIGELEERKTIEITDFIPEKDSFIFGFRDYANKLISLKVTRTFAYQELRAVTKDSDRKNYQVYNDAKEGINILDIKNWFINRYLYSAHKGAITEHQLKNLELAKKCFSLLNGEFSFSRVEASSNEIMINTPSGEIYYEYLSSGFKSCISILFGIIKEIEFRFKSPCILAKDFDGIILIDELELHLHPEWQNKIATILKNTFPSTQFITTTHSPHIIQSAEQNEIIALENQNLNVTRRKFPENKYGFQGWTIEEVLIDIMGMVDTRTSVFNNLIKDFETSMKDEDYTSANETYKKLDKLLHPESHMKKLLKLELASIYEVTND